MKSLFCLVFAISINASAGEIAPFIQKQLQVKGTTSALVILKSQADVESLNLHGLGRVERIETVYKALVKHANETQKSLIDYLKSKKIKFRRFFISNAILVENVSKAQIKSLAKLPDVGQVAGNPAVELRLPLTEINFRATGGNIAATGAERVWKELKVRGEGIVIGGQDTGYQWDHPALKSHYRGNQNGKISHNYFWHDSVHAPFNPSVLSKQKTNSCGYDVKAPCDDDQHGTHTMGTMVGSDGADRIGMAPGAKWIGCRNMDAGFGNPASYLECFQFFLAPTPVDGDPFTTGKPEMAPHVVNNSWGCPPEEGCTGIEMLPALKALKSAGIIVVASAGNDGPDCSTIKDTPAYHGSYAITVGAYNHRDGSIASFSSRGPSTFDGGVGPDVVAPGVSIRSSVPGDGYDGTMWSGTSMAGPHVVGQIALMLSAQPNLIGKVDEVANLVRRTAEHTSSSESCGGVPGGSIPNNTYGFGKIRVFEAVKAALATK